MAAVTGTVTVQVLLAGIEFPAAKITVEPPVGAVTVPLQVVLALPETTIPAGNVSVSGAVKLATVMAGLLNVMVRVDMSPALIAVGLKALPSVGVMIPGALTVKVAMAKAVLLPFPVCKAPAANELM